jgi:sugar/nucleoside kinase (ribokinase family)
VGGDALGKQFRENLKKSQVTDLTITDSDQRTGICIALTYPDGERSMVADRGANDLLAPRDIEQKLKTILTSNIIYLSGYSLARMDAEETLPVLKRCREHGSEIWLNTGAPNIITDALKHTIYQFFDALMMNFDEAKALTGTESIPEIEAALEKVARLSVITLGKEGCLVIRNGQRISIGTKALIDITDTTGAGDTFAAGFIVGRLRQLPDIECARLANETAARFLEEKRRLSQ